jgi:polysaccharide deacetylase 2 family uncharacterized protein YibQ
MARRNARRAIGMGWVLTWPLTAVFAAMVFLAAEEIRQPERSTPSIGGPNWEAHFHERVASVNAALEHSSLALPAPSEEQKGSGALRWTHRSYDLTLPHSEQARVESEIEALRAVDPGLTLTTEVAFDGTQVQIGIDGLLTHTLRIHWQEKKTRPRVAMVVVNLGDDLRIARAALDLGAPVALGVRPFRPFSREVAELGRIFKQEVVIDLSSPEDAAPAEPGRDDVGTLLESALQVMPHAVGVTGDVVGKPLKRHGGSAVRAALEEHDLFYVGPGAPRVDGTEGMPVVDAPTLPVGAGGHSGAVSEQLAAILSAARQNGSAVAFARPDQETLDALRAALVAWHDTGVDVVPISSLASASSLSGH